MMAGCLVALCALAAAAATASAAPPEFGTCTKVAPKTGQYSGKNCLYPAPGKGSYVFVPGGGAKKKFTFSVESPVLRTSGGREVSCVFGEGEGEYASAKTVNITKLVFSNCQAPGAKTTFESWCQNIGNFRGEVTMNELTGELGYNEHAARTKVGLDIKPKTGKALVLFECGGANEVTEHGMGTGTVLEVEGSVIGRVKTINKPTQENLVTFTAKNGAQVPEQFEGGVKDTLTTLVGPTKTPEPSRFSGIAEVTNEEPIEVKAQ
jgi:hypothetical protein